MEPISKELAVKTLVGIPTQKERVDRLRRGIRKNPRVALFVLEFIFARQTAAAEQETETTQELNGSDSRRLMRRSSAALPSSIRIAGA